MIIFLLIIFQLFSVFIWSWLVKTYSLYQHYNIPFFAMDKIPHHFNSPIIQQTLLAFISLSIIYLINLCLIKKINNNIFKNIIILITILTVIIPIFIYPVNAIDIFDYIAQSKIFYFYKQNPYLTNLASAPYDNFWQYAGWQNQGLLYGPIWLISVFLPNLLVNYSNNNALVNSLILFKTQNFILLLIVAFIITKIHSSKKLFYWYLFVGNPFITYEVIANGHNEILVVLFLILAIYFSKKRPNLTCLFLTLMALIKIYFILLIPLYLFRLIIINRYNFKKIIKPLLFSAITFFLIYLPFIFKSGFKPILINMFASQNYFTYSINSLIREYLYHYNYSSNFILFAQIILYFIFFILSVLIIKKTLKNNLFFMLFIVINLLIIFLTFSHPWYFIGSIALLTCLKENKHILLLIFFITLSLLCFYPISVWLWFNSGLNVLNIHQGQTLFILPLAIYSIVYIYQLSQSSNENKKNHN